MGKILLFLFCASSHFCYKFHFKSNCQPEILTETYTVRVFWDWIVSPDICELIFKCYLNFRS
jgi:hypothetical protein